MHARHLVHNAQTEEDHGPVAGIESEFTGTLAPASGATSDVVDGQARLDEAILYLGGQTHHKVGG